MKKIILILFFTLIIAGGFYALVTEVNFSETEETSIVNYERFDSSELGISFDYPLSFGLPRLESTSPHTLFLSFADGLNIMLIIKTITLDGIIRMAEDDQEGDVCDAACLDSLTTQQKIDRTTEQRSRIVAAREQWDNEKEILRQQNNFGKIPCSEFGYIDCAVVKVGNLKMLAMYHKDFPRLDWVGKDYIFFVGDKRFTALIDPDRHEFSNLNLEAYQKKEKTSSKFNLSYKVLESIVEIEK